VPKLSANLSWLFTEVDFAARFGAAAEAGFKAVECLFPYELKAAEVARRLAQHNLQMVLINAPPGDWQGGERGLGCLAGRQADFRRALDRAIDYALAIGCPNIHIMAGIGGAEATSLYVENLHVAARACAAAGVRGLIEPINPVDMPGYFLNRPEQAMDILQAVSSPHLGLQLDLYHVARLGLDPGHVIDGCLDAIAHFQIAGMAGRHEPEDDDDINARALFKKIDALGYDGWIGCEYRPRTTTVTGLDWAAPYLVG